MKRFLKIFTVAVLALSGLAAHAAGEYPKSVNPDFDREDRLLKQFYNEFGRGNYPHVADHMQRRGMVQTKAIWSHALGYLVQDIKFENAYERVFVPVLDQTFPELRTDPRYAELYKKTVEEADKNWYFGYLTAKLHKSKVPAEANIWFGVSHPIYDVIFDDGAVSDWSLKEKIQRVEKIIQRNYRISRPSKSEQLLIKIVQGLDASLPPQNRAVFFKYLQKLHDAQVDSIQQHFPDMSDTFLRRTTFRKGGYSMVLYALLADHNFTQDELDTYFLEGAFLQSLDDFNDLAEDTEQGIQTMAMRKLQSPEDQWKMRDVLRERFLSLGTADGQYSGRRVEVYFRALDRFIKQASGQYNEDFIKLGL